MAANPLATKDSITFSGDRSLPPKQGNHRAKVTLSLSSSPELGLTMISLVPKEINVGQSPCHQRFLTQWFSV
jgi:hypothetical protein